MSQSPPTQKQTQCCWPECRFRAITEIKRGPMPFVQLCGSHRPLWDLLSDTALREMAWKPKRTLRLSQ